LLPGTELASAELAISSEGSIELLGPPVLTSGPLANGQAWVFEIPVRFTASSRAAVFVRALADDGTGGDRFEKNEGIYTIFHNNRPVVAMGDYLRAEQRAIEQDLNSGAITEMEARAQMREKSKPERLLKFTLPPMQNAPPPPSGAQILAPAPLDGGEIALQASPASPTGNITVQGTVTWLDENGAVHPAFGVTVQVRDDELIGSELVAAMATGTDGAYNFVVDNDDGIGAGNRDIFVRFITANSAVSIETEGILHAAYEADTGIYDETPDGTLITENFTAANTGTGPSVGLLTGATYVASYTAHLNSDTFLSHIRFEWPGDTGSANYNGSRINMRPGDRWDWDVMFHEYGHYVQDSFNFEDGVGGPHNIGDCIADVHNSKSEGVRMSWSEGWPTYFGTVAQDFFNLSSLGVPRVGDVNYGDTGESNFSYSLDAQDNNGRGEDNELTVQRILWDYYDTNSDGRDNVTTSETTLFNILRGTNTETLSGGIGLIRATLSNQQDLAYGAITTDHLVGPSLNSPVAGAIVSPSSANFSWDALVGCPSSYSGDGFTLRFYNAGTFAPILSLPVGNTTSRALTLGELQTLVASSHQVLWAVEGSNSSSPATGPYLGESFAITVNQPPVADAGPNQTVECESHTTTSAALNGSGSSDPDGDALTYHWTGPVGVTFDDANAMITTGHFPEGVTTVTLTVSDGIESDQDQMQVTVEDTTPPVIVCPANITVECTSHDGTPKDDAQLVPFFSGASATDVCDSTPELTDDAPDYFALGATVVTFTATDADGNASSCQATVTVEDTTPPEITVELNRDVLWPPNHKMSDILATVVVTDICDPNPTFVLTSITSDEPDNGSGDGDTDGDIVADLLTPDQVFQLRSERMGGGDGRKYTIIYTASDGSGNTAPDTACVRVPHDQSGMALCSVGFSANGASLDPQAPGFRLVVVSTAGMDAWRLDPKRVYVGNQETVISPIETRLVDVDQDGNLDLEVIYDAATARDMRALGGKKNPLGLHYQSADGVDYLVSDIFGLGAPIALVEDPTKRDEGELADIIAADDPTDQQPGMSVNTMEVKPGLQAGPQGSTLTLAESGPVLVEIFNVTGRRVKTLVNADLARGPHTLRWDGRDDSGRQMPGGIYFYRVQAPGLQTVKKVLLAR
jgi:hypothetical protein